VLLDERCPVRFVSHKTSGRTREDVSQSTLVKRASRVGKCVSGNFFFFWRPGQVIARNRNY
jgi:hypothetical protein